MILSQALFGLLASTSFTFASGSSANTSIPSRLRRTVSNLTERTLTITFEQVPKSVELTREDVKNLSEALEMDIGVSTRDSQDDSVIIDMKSLEQACNILKKNDTSLPPEVDGKIAKRLGAKKWL